MDKLSQSGITNDTRYTVYPNMTMVKKFLCLFLFTTADAIKQKVGINFTATICNKHLCLVIKMSLSSMSRRASYFCFNFVPPVFISFKQ